MEEHFFKFSNLACFPELVHGISNRSHGDMRQGFIPDSEVMKNRSQFLADLNINLPDVIIPKQVHSNIVLVMTEKDKGKTAPADGLVTTEKGLFLGVLTADCIPIFMYDPALKIVAVVHGGWRGIIDQIVPEAINKMRALGTEPENLVFGIGPGICQKHFTVQNSVLKLFLDNYPSATFVRNKDGYVDLKKAVSIDLKKANVHPGNIEVSSDCTVCDNGIYGSYRKEGKGAPEMLAIVGIKND